MVAKIDVGIDCGKNTGICILIDGRIKHVSVKTILKAMFLVKAVQEEALERVSDVKVRLFVENPNSWGYGDKRGSVARLQGAGSVKRDFSIWQEFAELYEFEFIPPSVQSVGALGYEKNVSLFMSQYPYIKEICPKIEQGNYKHAREAVACVAHLIKPIK